MSLTKADKVWLCQLAYMVVHHLAGLLVNACRGNAHYIRNHVDEVNRAIMEHAQ